MAACLAAAAVTGLAAASYWRLTRELQAVTAARVELAEVAAEAEELERELSQIEQERTALQEVWQKRFSWSRFLSDLWASLPSGVWLTDLSVKGSELTLQGGAASAGNVAQFLQRLVLVAGVRAPQLVKLEGNPALRFTVKATLERPLLPERGEGD
ncbi:MAG: PilN domain-containing protein [Moorellales bacterium]